MMDRLPLEIIMKIFKYLSGNDLVRASMVCRKWENLSRVDELWKFQIFYVSNGKFMGLIKFLLTKIHIIERLTIRGYNDLNIMRDRDHSLVIESNILIPVATDAESYYFTKMLFAMKKLRCLTCFLHIKFRRLPKFLKHLTCVVKTDFEIFGKVNKYCTKLQCFVVNTFKDEHVKEGFQKVIEANKVILRQLSANFNVLDDTRFGEKFFYQNLESVCLYGNGNFNPKYMKELSKLKFLKSLHIDFLVKGLYWHKDQFLKFKFNSLVSFSALMANSYYYDPILTILHVIMPNLTTLSLEFKLCHPPMFMIEHCVKNLSVIENFVIKNDPCNPEYYIPSIILYNFELILENKLLNICLCQAKLEYEKLNGQERLHQSWSALRKKFERCKICHLYSKIFLCGCF